MEGALVLVCKSREGLSPKGSVFEENLYHELSSSWKLWPVYTVAVSFQTYKARTLKLVRVALGRTSLAPRQFSLGLHIAGLMKPTLVLVSSAQATR